MQTMIGFTSSLKAPGMEALHRARAVFCTDPNAGGKYGRAKVFVLGDKPGEWRDGGVAVVYGRASAAMVNILRKQVPPVLVLVTEKAVGGRKTPQILDRLVMSGRTVVQVVIEDGEVTKLCAYEGAAEITTVSTGGSLA